MEKQSSASRATEEAQPPVGIDRREPAAHPRKPAGQRRVPRRTRRTRRWRASGRHGDFHRLERVKVEHPEHRVRVPDTTSCPGQGQSTTPCRSKPQVGRRAHAESRAAAWSWASVSACWCTSCPSAHRFRCRLPTAHRRVLLEVIVWATLMVMRRRHRSAPKWLYPEDRKRRR